MRDFSAVYSVHVEDDRYIGNSVAVPSLDEIIFDVIALRLRRATVRIVGFLAVITGTRSTFSTFSSLDIPTCPLRTFQEGVHSP